MFIVLLSGRAQKDLKRLDLVLYKRVIKSLRMLESSPFLGKRLHGEISDLYRLRVHPIRCIYTMDKEKKLITVTNVGYRGDIYKKL